MSFWNPIRRILESRRIVLLATLVGIVLTLPTVFTGLHTEDVVQRMRVVGGGAAFPDTVNLFGNETPLTAPALEQKNHENQVRGWLPWTAHPRFDVSFWRPLSSLTHHLDYRVLDVWPWMMHAENVLWYGLLVFGAASLYGRTLETPWIAGLSSVLYAIDDAHGHAVGWLANRNGVMAACFGVLSIVLFDRGRRDGSRASAALVPLTFAAALLSAEFGLCTAGYFIAHGVFLDRAPVKNRLIAALPWVLTLALWSVVYRGLGHASYGSGLYINPTSEPAAFFAEMLERWVVLFAAQFGAPPSDLWTRVDRADQGGLVFAAVVFGFIVVKAMWPILQKDRTARFYAAGVLLSLPPACATFPEDRLLFFAGLGAMPLVATFIARVFDETERRALWERPRLAACLGGAFVFLHAAVAPAALPYRSLHMNRYDAAMRTASAQVMSFGSGPDDAIVIVNGKDSYFLSMLAPTRFGRSEPFAPIVFALAGTLDDVAVTRTGPQTIVVRPKDGFLSRVFNVIYRGRSHPFHRGQEVKLLGCDIRVVEINQWGEPLAASFSFTLPLDHPRLKWVAWQGGQVRRFVVPELGDTVVVRGR